MPNIKGRMRYKGYISPTPGRMMPDSSFDKRQLEKGTIIEMKEHGVSKLIGKRIAKDHLAKNKNSYKK